MFFAIEIDVYNSALSTSCYDFLDSRPVQKGIVAFNEKQNVLPTIAVDKFEQHSLHELFTEFFHLYTLEFKVCQELLTFKFTSVINFKSTFLANSNYINC